MANIKAHIQKALRLEQKKRAQLKAAVREHTQAQRILARAMAAAERDLAKIARRK